MLFLHGRVYIYIVDTRINYKALEPKIIENYLVLYIREWEGEDENKTAMTHFCLAIKRWNRSFAIRQLRLKWLSDDFAVYKKIKLWHLKKLRKKFHHPSALFPAAT